MTQRLKSFFHNRTGWDFYTLFLLLLFFLLRSAARMTGLLPLMIPAYLVLGYSIFRVFSRNREKRQVENARFLTLTQSVTRWFRHKRAVYTDKEHLYFKCPNCGQPLRVPRGKGRIQVFCRSCGAHFEETS